MPMPSTRRVGVAALVAALLAVPTAVATAPVAQAVGPATAPAQPYPPTGGTIYLSSDEVPAGGPLIFIAAGFTGGERVIARLTAATTASGSADQSALLTTRGQATRAGGAGGDDMSQRPGGTARADRAMRAGAPPAPAAPAPVIGTFRALYGGYVAGAVTIPRRTIPGGYVFSLTGARSGHTATAHITVQPAGFPFPIPSLPNFPQSGSAQGSSAAQDRSMAQGRNDAAANQRQGVGTTLMDAAPVARQSAAQPSGSRSTDWVLAGSVGALTVMLGGCLATRSRRRRTRAGRG